MSLTKDDAIEQLAAWVVERNVACDDVARFEELTRKARNRLDDAEHAVNGARFALERILAEEGRLP